MIKKLFGRFAFIVVPCLLGVIAGGGIAFIRQPIGMIYLILWAAWQIVTALGRPRGVSSPYDRGQRTIVALGGVALFVLIVVPPWEYAHFTGPIPRNGPLAWAGLVLFTAGIVLQAAAMWALHGLYTLRLGVQPGHRLVTSGPYRLVRHPGYLSNIMSIAGIGLALSSLVALVLAILVVPFLLWRIGREEEMLVAELGEDYLTYMKQTKRLIPLIY